MVVQGVDQWSASWGLRHFSKWLIEALITYTVNILKVKLKVTLEQATKVCRGSRVISVLFL